MTSAPTTPLQILQGRVTHVLSHHRFLVELDPALTRYGPSLVAVNLRSQESTLGDFNAQLDRLCLEKNLAGRRIACEIVEMNHPSEYLVTGLYPLPHEVNA